MGYIYKITNDINDKIYVGKTEFTLEERFAEHCRDSLKSRYEKRPLYDAMQKYGIEHFKIEEIEQTEDLENREQYWIAELRTYIGFSDCKGYNATLGGDGKTLIDYDYILQEFMNGLNITEIAEKTGHDKRSYL